MPLLVLLQSLQPLIVLQSLRLSNSLQHILNSRHHTLQPTEIDMCSIVELGEDLVSILLNLILNIHLSSLLVFLFTGQGIVQTEVVGELLLSLLPLIIILLMVVFGMKVQHIQAWKQGNKAYMRLFTGLLLIALGFLLMLIANGTINLN